MEEDPACALNRALPQNFLELLLGSWNICAWQGCIPGVEFRFLAKINLITIAITSNRMFVT